jgi:hypothetical protein
MYKSMITQVSFSASEADKQDSNLIFFSLSENPVLRGLMELPFEPVFFG